MATDIKFDVEKHIQKYEIPETELELEPPLGPFQSLENSPKVEPDLDFTAGESADEYYESWEDIEMPTNSQKVDTAIQKPKKSQRVDTAIQKPKKSQKVDTAIQKPQHSQKVDTAIQKSRKSQKYDIEPIKTGETRTRSGRQSRSPNRLQFTVVTRAPGQSSATEF